MGFIRITDATPRQTLLDLIRSKDRSIKSLMETIADLTAEVQRLQSATQPPATSMSEQTSLNCTPEKADG